MERDGSDSLGTTSEHGPTVVLGGEAEELDEERLAAGTLVGRYKIAGVLGAGGMGVVYAAEDPELGRTVALKVLKLRHRTRDRDEPDRLRREARALAQLAHPNVVRVFDVGLYEGRVFLALELVPGPTVAEWLDSPRGWPEVVDVFLEAGRGLAAAHRAGLVHRDFKPSNVLLSEDDGRVRVMDFGLAAPAAVQRSIDVAETGSEETTGAGVDDSRTREGIVVGTPAYLSPEHLRGGVVDGRSDQFAFCVSLYFALYGVAPFPSTSRERYAAIRAGDLGAPKPGRTAPGWLHAAIVRGLALRPEDRWPDMESLLAALQRNKRRRWPWAVGVVAAGGVAAVIAWPAAEAVKCDQDRVRQEWDARRGALHDAFVATGRGNAEESSTRVAELIDAWVEAWTAARAESCASEASRDSDVRSACLDAAATRLSTVVEALGSATASMVDRGVTIAERLPRLEDCNDPAEAATRLPDDETTRDAVLAVRETIAEAKGLEDVNEFDKARALFDQALPRAREIGYAPLLAEVEYEAAVNLRQMARYQEAVPLVEDAVSVATAQGLDRLEALSAAELGVIYGHHLEDIEAATRWFRQAQAAAARDDRRPTTAAYAAHNAGIFDLRQGRYAQARSRMQFALKTYEEQHGKGCTQCARALINLANIDTQEGKYAHAIELQEEAREIYEKRAGKEHPTVAMILANIALGYEGLGQYEEALRVGEQALAMRQRVLGDGHPDTGTSYSNIGLVLLRQDRLDEARARLEKALEVWTASMGEDHTLVAAALTNLGLVLAAQGEVETALADHRRALRIRERTLPAGHPEIATSLANIGNNLRRLGRYDEARENIERAQAIWLEAFGPDHPESAAVHEDFAALAEAQGDFQAADAEYERAYETWLRISGPDHPESRAVQRRRARLWFEQAQSLDDRAKALELASGARDVFATDDKAADELAEVQRWLDEHSR